MRLQKIDLIEPKDVPEILEIIKKEFPYKEIGIERFHERALQPSVFIFKILEGKKLAGFIDLEFLDEQTGRITAMSVLAQYRGKKIGKKLVEFAIDFFKKQACGKIVLLVKQSNETAKKIYSLAGFRKTKTLANKIDGETVEEMVKTIED